MNAILKVHNQFSKQELNLIHVLLRIEELSFVHSHSKLRLLFSLDALFYQISQESSDIPQYIPAHRLLQLLTD